VKPGAPLKRKTPLRTSRQKKTGRHDRRVKYDQDRVQDVIAAIRAAELTIAQGARDIGCHQNYLGRRVWQETRRDVLKRDGEQCAVCGHRAGDVHHRRRKGSGGSRDPRIAYGWANLISLCRIDHSWVHNSRAEALDAGLVLEENDVPAEVPVAHVIRGSIYLLDDGSLRFPPEWGGDVA
jgi:5-methylcytosine-specific restriction enzyme A